MRTLLLISLFAASVTAFAKPAPQAKSMRSVLRDVARDRDFANLAHLPHVRVELKYATTDNLLKKNVYGPFDQAFLHRNAAAKLKSAAKRLHTRLPGATLVIYDALRPRSVQRALWKLVVGTSKQSYVVNPEFGSMHNYGLAVDLTIENAYGHALDMGTEYDSLKSLAQPKLEKRFLAEGKLTAEQVGNRQLLRSVMTEAGFRSIGNEWWHFDATSWQDAHVNYRIVE